MVENGVNPLHLGRRAQAIQTLVDRYSGPNYSYGFLQYAGLALGFVGVFLVVSGKFGGGTEAPLITGADAARTLAATLAVRRSAETGRAVALDGPDPA